jgi:hypothetical protein
LRDQLGVFNFRNAEEGVICLEYIVQCTEGLMSSHTIRCQATPELKFAQNAFGFRAENSIEIASTKRSRHLRTKVHEGLLQDSDCAATFSPTHRRRVSGSGQNTSIRIKSGTVEHDDPPESNIQPHNNTGLPSACIQPGGRLSEIVEWSEIPNFSHDIYQKGL